VSKPFFSLVTVCYNAERSIANTLQSAREQTCRDFENVVVDGASTDGTLDVVHRFDDLPLAITSEPDKGIDRKSVV
jgi:glycosyltransferase involved in cell wall biosynthesis